MIFGIGTDIVAIARIEAGLERHGNRFAQRILAESEWPGFEQSANPASFLAKRFAAKEAVVKAMGTGFSDGISMKDIVVTHDQKGRPLVEFSGRAAVLCSELMIGKSHLSLADERDHAIAFVTLLDAVR